MCLLIPKIYYNHSDESHLEELPATDSLPATETVVQEEEVVSETPGKYLSVMHTSHSKLSINSH